MSDNRFIDCGNGEYMRAVNDDAQDKCASCSKKSTACISFFAHENAMMHKDTDNERAHRTTFFVCITFLLIVIIFVFAYTVRMNSFLSAINKLTADIVELAGAKGIISP